jgi:hypothetical protein
MRKVTEQISNALINGKKKTVGNTSTDGSSMFLHGNEIIKSFTIIDGYKLNWIHFNLRSDCTNGLPSSTTRERLNGFLDSKFPDCGFSFGQKNWTAVIHGYKDGKHVYKNIPDDQWLSFSFLSDLFNN